VAARAAELVPSEKEGDIDDQCMMLDTIVVPHDMSQLASRLPGSNYEEGRMKGREEIRTLIESVR